MIPVSTNLYQNRIGRIVLLAMEEVIGHGDVIAILDHKYIEVDSKNDPLSSQIPVPSKENIICLLGGLESFYGLQAGRGLGMRVGRACLLYGLKEFGAELGLSEQSYRLLPVQTKIKVGNEAFASFFNHFPNLHVMLEFDEKYIYWHLDPCPLCLIRQADDIAVNVKSSGPCCQVAVGFLQEAMYWISGGKYYEVFEDECIACGDSKCTIVINQIPFG